MEAQTSKYILAGFGGQGVLFVGKAIAQAGMQANKQVTWIPSYGPEMRGGTANCSVVISDKRIGSPTVAKPDVAVVMNSASYDKFLNSVVPGGTLYVNSSIIPELPARADIWVVRVPVNDIARDLGNPQVANIVMLGAVQALTPSVTDAVMDNALRELAAKMPALAELNARALAAGKQYARNLELLPQK